MADRPPADREANLDRLREQAARQTPRLEPIAGYYGRPVLKPAVWTWEIPLYLFIGGAAGVCAVIAWVAQLFGEVAIAGDARIVAAAGGVLSPLLLISDLGRPARFLNMLRIFKPQSPMSVGAWTLAVFAMAALGSLAGHRTPELDGTAVITLMDAMTGLSGLLLATYPGVLIGATAIPVWSHHVRVLPWHFAASSLGAAASVLELMGHRTPAMNAIGISAAALVTAIAARFEFRKDRVSLPLVSGTSGLMTRLGDALCGPLPLVLRLASGAVPAARLPGAIMAIVGSLLTRFGWIAAGRRSVQDPQLVLDGGAR
jgi:Polysulphide reductase, NrfD